MTIQDILNEAYEDTNTSIANYPYEKALKKLNSIYKELYRMIVHIDENYFWTWWNTDLQAWAREYKVERKETSYVDPITWDTVYVPWIEKVKKVSICNNDTFKDELVELADLEERCWYKWWVLKDNHIFLNWTPEEDIEWGLQIEWIQAINNVELTDDESVIFPWHEDLQDFYDVLMHWVKKELWEHKQDFEKADREKQEYENRKEVMRRYIAERTNNIYYSDLQR